MRQSMRARVAAKGDVIIDGGNSYYADDIRRAKQLASRGIRYVDCGTSGGVWGDPVLERIHGRHVNHAPRAGQTESGVRRAG